MSKSSKTYFYGVLSNKEKQQNSPQKTNNFGTYHNLSCKNTRK